MKITAKSILLVLALLVTSFTSLQAQRGGGRSPEATAERQTKMMTDSLTLSPAQVKKANEINLKYAKMKAESRKTARENMASDGDREAMRNNMRAMYKKVEAERKAELSVILTSDQNARLEQVEANRENNRGERVGKGNRGKKGKGRRAGRKGENKKEMLDKKKHEQGEGEHEKREGENGENK